MDPQIWAALIGAGVGGLIAIVAGIVGAIIQYRLSIRLEKMRFEKQKELEDRKRDQEEEDQEVRDARQTKYWQHAHIDDVREAVRTDRRERARSRELNRKKPEDQPDQKP